MPLFGPPNVEKLKAKGDIKGLWKLTFPDQGDLSKQACRALLEIGAPAVVPLLDHMRGRPTEEKNIAVAVLRGIGEPAVDPLLSALNGKDEDRREVAVRALGAIAAPRTGEAFLELLRNEHIRFTTQLIAVAFAAKIMGPRAQEPLLAFFHEGSSLTSVVMKGQTVALALGNMGDERSMDVLAELTKRRYKDAPIDTDPRIRATAVEALAKVAGRLKDTPNRNKAEAVLVGLIKDHEPGLRAYACLGLGQVIGHHAAEPLIAALRDSDPLVRSSAAFGLRGSLDPVKAEPLIPLLQHADKQMRVNAAQGLGTGNDPRTVSPLIACLKDKEPAVRRAALESLLGFPNDASVFQAVVASLKDADAEVRSSAVLVLGTLGIPAVQPLMGCLKDSDAGVRAQAALHLGSIKDAEAVEALIQALKDQEWTVRYSCLKSLGQIGTAQAVDAIKASLNDGNEYVRQAAVEALK